MPTIQGKKNPDNVQFVTADVWEMMIVKGISRRYVIVDDDDLKQTIVATPHKIEFDTPPIAEEIVEKTVQELDIAEDDRDSLKQWLTEKGIVFNVRASTQTLYKLYQENK